MTLSAATSPVILVARRIFGFLLLISLLNIYLRGLNMIALKQATFIIEALTFRVGEIGKVCLFVLGALLGG